MNKKHNIQLLITVILFFTTSNVIGQAQELDSCGLDTLSLLNIHESNYLNKVFSNDNFNFENKIVKFRSSNFGHFPSNKELYFKDVKDWKKLDNRRIHEEVIILTDEEKKIYGNVDAIIVSWSKFSVTNNNRKKALKMTLKS